KDQDGSRIFYEPLVSYDPDGNLVPFLAAEVPSLTTGMVAKDGKSVVWRLRKDVVWHDGKPFTADDCVFTWEFVMDKETASVSIGSYKGSQTVEKPDHNGSTADFKPGDGIRAELNPTYYVPNRPFFDQLELKGGGDAVSAARAVIQTGEYDFACNLQAEGEILRRME